jgi:HK97 family phage major capsid protein
VGGIAAETRTGATHVDKIKALLNELASVVAEMEAMSESPAEGDSPAMSEEQEASLRSLETRAEKLKEQIAFLERVAAKNVELRAVLERAAPAKAVETIETPETKEPAVETRHFAIPRANGRLKGFSGPNAEERAYRAGMHFKGHVLGDEEARRWCRDHGVESRAQAGGINSLGGVLVSDEMSSEIIRLVEEFGAFPANARRVSMTSDTMLMARRTGGLSARPIGENAVPATSDVTFDNVQLVAKLWGIDNRVSNSLLEDSIIDLADTMAVEVAQSFAEAFDNAGFIGDGAGATYHGVTGVATAINDGTHTASVVTAATNNDVFADLTIADFTSLVAKLPLYARRNARFYISPAGYGSSMLRLMTSVAGNNAADVAAGAGLQFLGFPVVLCHPLQSALTGTASTIACLFGDLSQAATFGERRAITIKTDGSRFIEYDQTLTFATSRVAIVAHDLGSTTKAGPIVALKFAA